MLDLSRICGEIRSLFAEDASTSMVLLTSLGAVCPGFSLSIDG